MEFDISLTHDPNELQKLEAEWQTLQDNSYASSIYSTWHWTTLWWKNMGGENKLWLMLARDKSDNRLVGIAPLMSVNHQPKLGPAWQQIQFISSTSPCEHLDFIVEKGAEEALIPAFINTLLENSSGWDVLHLSRIIETSPTLTILDSLEIDWQHENEEFVAPFIELPSDGETYFSEYLSKRMRKNQRRSRKKLDETFPDNWSFDHIEDPEKLDDALDTLIELHQDKWEALDIEGAFGNPQVRSHLREAAHLFLKQGWLRLFQLILDGQVVATTFAYHYRGRIYDFVQGLNPDFLTTFRVGNMLNELAIRAAIDEGVKEYDLLWGDEDYKYSLGAKNRYDHTRILTNSNRAKLQKGTIRFLRQAKQWVSSRSEEQSS